MGGGNPPQPINNCRDATFCVSFFIIVVCNNESNTSFQNWNSAHIRKAAISKKPTEVPGSSLRMYWMDILPETEIIPPAYISC